MNGSQKHSFRVFFFVFRIVVAASTFTAVMQGQNPIGYWTFNSGGGTQATDTSGNGHTASLVNGVSWVAGQIGYAVSANSANSQYVTIPDINLSTTNAVTVAFWSKREYSTSGGHVLLENTQNYNSSTTGFGFFPDDPDCKGIRAAVHGNSGYTAMCYGQPTSNVWHHIAVVYDKSKAGAGEVTLYIDGALQKSTGYTYLSDNNNNFGNNPIYLFARGGSSQFDSGAVDDLRLYNTALTATQIQQIYQNGICQLTADPTSMVFKNTALGYSYSYPASIVNNCTEAITVFSAQISGAPYSISGFKVPFAIAPGQTQNYTTVFTPTTVGTANGSIAFVSNVAAGKALPVSLSGTGVASQQGVLSSSPATLSFGNVTISNTQSLSATITNTGSASVTVSAVKVTGTGFSLKSVATPFVLNEGQSIQLAISFAPTTNGAATGTLTVTSNAQNVTLTVPLSGTGVTHSVTLSWTALTSQIKGYNVYRSTTSNGSYTKINSALSGTPTYSDQTVVAATTYFYAVTAVGLNGMESAYSNQATVTVP
jgi:hypothetical protein